MSESPRFPNEEGSNLNSHFSEEEKREPQFHAPEFVLIDERSGEKKYSYFGSTSFQHSQKMFEEPRETKHSSKGSLRFICLLGFIFCAIFGIGMFLGAIVMTFLSVISLFQNANQNQGMWKLWKYFINTVVASFGFMLGMISPTLGFGLLAIYFSLASQLADDDILLKVIRRSFNHL